MLRIPFELLKVVFECFETVSNGSNLHSNALKPFRKGLNLHSNASNHFPMLRIPFECLESLLNPSNLHSNASNPFHEFAFECFQTLSSG